MTTDTQFETVAEHMNRDHGCGRVVVWLDWAPRINEREARRLEQRLRARDYDADVVTVYGDGLRTLDDRESKELTYWRKPLLTLEAVLERVFAAGAREVSGFWLPTGFGCDGGNTCGHAYSDEEDEPCALGDCISCVPDPTTAPRFRVERSTG